MQRSKVLGVVLMVYVGWCLPASGASVIFDEVGTLIGSGVTQNTHTFTLSSSGKYRITLVDFGAPSPATSIGFSVTNAANAVLGASAIAGMFEFSAVSGVHTINVSGIAGAANFSNYGVHIQTTPLPSAALLFAGALASVLGLTRRRFRPLGS